MLDILTARPSPGSYRHRPMTTLEVDAHPDCDRLWATIAAIQGHGDQREDEGRESAESDAETATEETWREASGKLDDEIDDLIADEPGLSREDLVKRIEKLRDCLE